MIGRANAGDWWRRGERAAGAAAVCGSNRFAGLYLIRYTIQTSIIGLTPSSTGDVRDVDDFRLNLPSKLFILDLKRVDAAESLLDVPVDVRSNILPAL